MYKMQIVCKLERTLQNEKAVFFAVLGGVWLVTPLPWYFTDKIVTPNAQDYVFILLQR